MCDTVEKLCHYNGRSCDKVAMLMYSSVYMHIHYISYMAYCILYIVYRIPYVDQTQRSKTLLGNIL